MAQKKPMIESAAPAADKKKALETCLAQLDKMYGKGTVMRLGGTLIFEVGMGQAGAVEDILDQNGYEDIKVLPDTQNILRVVEGTVNG